MAKNDNIQGCPGLEHTACHNGTLTESDHLSRPQSVTHSGSGTPAPRSEAMAYTAGGV